MKVIAKSTVTVLFGIGSIAALIASLVVFFGGAVADLARLTPQQLALHFCLVGLGVHKLGELLNLAIDRVPEEPQS